MTWLLINSKLKYSSLRTDRPILRHHAISKGAVITGEWSDEEIQQVVKKVNEMFKKADDDWQFDEHVFEVILETVKEFLPEPIREAL